MMDKSFRKTIAYAIMAIIFSFFISVQVGKYQTKRAMRDMLLDEAKISVSLSFKILQYREYGPKGDPNWTYTMKMSRKNMRAVVEQIRESPLLLPKGIEPHQRSEIQRRQGYWADSHYGYTFESGADQLPRRCSVDVDLFWMKISVNVY